MPDGRRRSIVLPIRVTFVFSTGTGNSDPAGLNPLFLSSVSQ